ncbi:MAG: hypothetical protein KA054_02490 [Candidatus Moranbacteria bacterium]|nr:hypothetical protein [Candidatus Moranbacteria bacterium]
MNKTSWMVVGAVVGGVLFGCVLQRTIDNPGQMGHRMRMESGQRMCDHEQGDGRQNSKGQSFGEGGDHAGRGQGGGMMGEKSGSGSSMNRENCVADDCLAVDGFEYPVGELSSEAKEALIMALDDEYKALTTYDATIGVLGEVRPFSMIRRAEEQHISSLKALFDKYGVTVPQNTHIGIVTSPSTLQAACQVGVDAEKANAWLYRGMLLPKVTAYPDLTQVFTRLMEASENRHLPAFERCN